MKQIRYIIVDRMADKKFQNLSKAVLAERAGIGLEELEGLLNGSNEVVHLGVLEEIFSNLELSVCPPQPNVDFSNADNQEIHALNVGTSALEMPNISVSVDPNSNFLKIKLFFKSIGAKLRNVYGTFHGKGSFFHQLPTDPTNDKRYSFEIHLHQDSSIFAESFSIRYVANNIRYESKYGFSSGLGREAAKVFVIEVGGPTRVLGDI